MAKDKYCLQCGAVVSRTQRVMPGSILIEIFLWLLMILPGLAYSIWRHAASYQGCPHCQGKQLVPVDSPVAQKALAR